MEIPIDLIVKAIRSAQNALNCEMKLTKKSDIPYLSLITSTEV